MASIGVKTCAAAAMLAWSRAEIISSRNGWPIRDVVFTPMPEEDTECTLSPLSWWVRWHSPPPALPRVSQATRRVIRCRNRQRRKRPCTNRPSRSVRAHLRIHRATRCTEPLNLQVRRNTPRVIPPRAARPGSPPPAALASRATKQRQRSPGGFGHDGRTFLVPRQ